MNKTLSQITQGNYFKANYTVKLPSGETLERTVDWSGENSLNSYEFGKLAKELNLTKEKALTLLDEKGVEVKLKWGDYQFESGKDLNKALRIVWENVPPRKCIYIPINGYVQAIKKSLKTNNVRTDMCFNAETIKPIIDAGLAEVFFHKHEMFKAGDKVIVTDAIHSFKESKYAEKYKGQVFTIKCFDDGAYFFNPSPGTGVYLNYLRIATSAEIAKSELKLPVINGYDGKISDNLVVYGCAKLPIEWFKDMPDSTRTITELTLSSNVKIKSEQMSKIRAYLKDKNLLK